MSLIVHVGGQHLDQCIVNRDPFIILESLLTASPNFPRLEETPGNGKDDAFAIGKLSTLRHS